MNTALNLRLLNQRIHALGEAGLESHPTQSHIVIMIKVNSLRNTSNQTRNRFGRLAGNDLIWYMAMIFVACPALKPRNRKLSSFAHQEHT